MSSKRVVNDCISRIIKWTADVRHFKFSPLWKKSKLCVGALAYIFWHKKYDVCAKFGAFTINSTLKAKSAGLKETIKNVNVIFVISTGKPIYHSIFLQISLCN